MPSTARAVRTCVRSDPYLEECLARDIVSHAKLARWLREEGEVQGSEHAIISALRRMEAMREPNPLDEAREALQRMNIYLFYDRVAVTAARGEEGQNRVAQLQEVLGEVPVLPSVESMTVIVPDEEQATARRILGESRVFTVREDLVELRIEDHSGAEDTKAVLGLVANQLALHEIQIEEVHTGGNALHILVHEADGARARRVVMGLKRGDG